MQRNTPEPWRARLERAEKVIRGAFRPPCPYCVTKLDAQRLTSEAVRDLLEDVLAHVPDLHALVAEGDQTAAEEMLTSMGRLTLERLHQRLEEVSGKA